MKKINLAAILLLFFGALTTASAADVLEDFDKLGGNEVLLEKARALQPDAEVSVVQDRLVKRHYRLEIAPEFGAVLGGDPYSNTRAFGLNAYFHINPYISIGAKYNHIGNEATSEAESLVNETAKVYNGKAFVPDVDYAKSQRMGLVNVYPFYGKVNVFNRIAHFDIYGVLGYGTIDLRSGSTSTWTTGAGVGFWVTNNFTARWELRYQNYKAQRYTGEADMNLTVSSLQAGYMF